MTQLMYREEEVLRMTPRKFFRLYDEYLETRGLKKKECGIDDLP